MNLNPNRHIFFPGISMPQSFDMLFLHLNRILCPFLGFLGPKGPPGIKLQLESFVLHYSTLVTLTVPRLKLENKRTEYEALPLADPEVPGGPKKDTLLC